APEDPLDQAVHTEVEDEQVQPEEERREYHDDSGRVDFLARRPSDALELVAHLTQEQPRALDTPAGGLSYGLKRCGFRHTTSQLPATELPDTRVGLAGQEGIEPPTPGFRDRCSAN